MIFIHPELNRVIYMAPKKDEPCPIQIGDLVEVDPTVTINDHKAMQEYDLVFGKVYEVVSISIHNGDNTTWVRLDNSCRSPCTLNHRRFRVLSSKSKSKFKAPETYNDHDAKVFEDFILGREYHDCT